MEIQGCTQGGGGVTGLNPTHQNRFLKNTDFMDRFYVIYPSAEINHWNQLMTSTSEFWEIN
jgi:hypothetical protein